jgi:hypothetical protein
MNGVDNIFKTLATYCDKTIIWIRFQKILIETLIVEKCNNYHNNNIKSKWRPIEPIIKNIKVHKFQSFIITNIRFPIQFVIEIFIHHFQGL